jgi:hypothetical protein
MGELLQALRDRRDELDISHETLDQISGLQSGYVSKLLAPKPIKNLGPVSLGPLLGALGVAITVVPDKEAIAAVKHRWQKRKRPQRLRPIQAASITTEGCLGLNPTGVFPARWSSIGRAVIGLWCSQNYQSRCC